MSFAKKMKTWKRKRDSNEAEAEKAGAIVVGDAPTFLEIITKEVLGLLAIEPEAAPQLKR